MLNLESPSQDVLSIALIKEYEEHLLQKDVGLTGQLELVLMKEKSEKQLLR